MTSAAHLNQLGCDVTSARPLGSKREQQQKRLKDQSHNMTVVSIFVQSKLLVGFSSLLHHPACSFVFSYFVIQIIEN